MAFKNIEVKDNDFTGKDFSGKRIVGRTYRNCVFNDCDMQNSVFFAKAYDCKFIGTDFTGSDLSVGVFQYCDFTDANLTNCKFPRHIDTRGARINVLNIGRFFGQLKGMSEELLMYYSDNSIPNFLKIAREKAGYSPSDVIRKLKIDSNKYNTIHLYLLPAIEGGGIIPDFEDLTKMLLLYELDELLIKITKISNQ